MQISRIRLPLYTHYSEVSIAAAESKSAEAALAAVAAAEAEMKAVRSATVAMKRNAISCSFCCHCFVVVVMSLLLRYVVQRHVTRRFFSRAS
jgi:hypothetical protein